MDETDFDLDLDDVGGGVTIVMGDEEEEFGCDDVRPAWLSAELMNLDAETQIGFNAIYSDR